jgi:hypothetical protein
VNKPIVAGVAALVAVIAAAVLLRNDSTDPSAPPAAASTAQPANGETPTPVGQSPAASASSTTTAPGQRDAPAVPSDPRLAALAVSPPNDLIEFVRGADGQVIKEIDKDPASAGFNKPSREYMYSHGQVIGLTAYRYLGNQVEITRTAVSYKPDGSVDQFVANTTYNDEQKP